MSFHSHWIIWIGVTNQKCSNSNQIISFSPCVTLKFDRCPWKTIGHLFYVTWSLVHHFVDIGEFKLELQSATAQFWSKSAIFRPMRPWNLRDHLEQDKSEGCDSCDRPCNFTLIGFSLCNLETWWMTSKNNRAPLIYYIKLSASFQIHRWTQTGVTVRKCSIQVKIGYFFTCVTLKFDGSKSVIFLSHGPWN